MPARLRPLPLVLFVMGCRPQGLPEPPKARDAASPDATAAPAPKPIDLEASAFAGATLDAGGHAGHGGHRGHGAPAGHQAPADPPASAGAHDHGGKPQ